MERDYTAIQRVLILTFIMNLVATLAKLGAGVWTGALSLVADGLDTLFDGLSNVIGLIAVRKGSQPPDEKHPYGHRKFETLAALFIAVLLFVTSWELGRSAVSRLMDAGAAAEVNQWSLAALLFGAAVQGATGWWELRRGRELQSEVLIADARHTLASLYVSGTVLLGLMLVWVGYAWADSLVALLVAGVIAKIGADTLRDNVPALVDQAPLTSDLIGVVVEGVTGVESFHRIRSRGTADNVAVDLHVRVDPRLSMQDANAIGDEVRRRLLQLAGVQDVTVHIEAQRGLDSAAHLASAVRLAAEELGATVHECWVQQAGDRVSLHLHVGVDPNLSLASAHDVVDRLEGLILERQSQVASVHSHIEPAMVDILPTARVSSGLQQRVEETVQQAVQDLSDIYNPHDIQVRQVEGRLFIAVEAWVAGDLSMADAHEISTRLQETIRASLSNVGDVLVHLEPEGLEQKDWAPQEARPGE